MKEILSVEQKLFIDKFRCKVEFENDYTAKVEGCNGVHPSCCDMCIKSIKSIKQSQSKERIDP
jgi:hypothetical protein